MAVCDQIGRFGFEAGVAQFFEDARKPLLKPGGRLIPRDVALNVSPVERPDIWEQIEFWNRAPAGFDFHQARAWAANTGYPTQYQAENLLSTPAVLATLDLTRDSEPTIRGEARFEVNREGTLHGMGGWFTATLAPGITMTNSSLSPETIERRNVFLPIDRPVAVAPGDCVHLRMRILPEQMILSWNIEIRGKSSDSRTGSNGLKGRFSHSTLRGMLLCSEDLGKTRPDYVPHLTP